MWLVVHAFRAVLAVLGVGGQLLAPALALEEAVGLVRAVQRPVVSLMRSWQSPMVHRLASRVGCGSWGQPCPPSHAGVGVDEVDRDTEHLVPGGLVGRAGDVEVRDFVLRPGDLLVVDLGSGVRLVGHDVRSPEWELTAADVLAAKLAVALGRREGYGLRERDRARARARASQREYVSEQGPVRACMVVFKGQKLWKPAERDSERGSRLRAGRARVGRSRASGARGRSGGAFRLVQTSDFAFRPRQSLWLENTESCV